LPGGLTLSTAGLLSGLPAQIGTTQVTIKVTDSGGASVSKPFTLTIGARVLTISTTALPAGTAGPPYTFTLMAISGATPSRGPAPPLPQGLSPDPATGILNGTPAQSGTTTLSVTVTDAANATASAQLPLVINPAPLQILTNALPQGTVGQPYNSTLTAM